MVAVGDITHGHFADYTEGATEEQRLETVTDKVLQFLVDLFVDKYILWRSESGAGGWWHVDHIGAETPSWAEGAKTYFWSGPRTP